MGTVHAVKPEARQLASRGTRIAIGGSDNYTAYGLAATGGVAHGCDCLTGPSGDEGCARQAAFSLLVSACRLNAGSPATPALVVARMRRDGSPGDGKDSLVTLRLDHWHDLADDVSAVRLNGGRGR
jgi:hypothetical protein